MASPSVAPFNVGLAVLRMESWLTIVSMALERSREEMEAYPDEHPALEWVRDAERAVGDIAATGRDILIWDAVMHQS